MPGPVSDTFGGPPTEGPYVPPWNYTNGPKMCPCGHHEGYHGDDGVCLFRKYDFRKEKRPHPVCTCAGLPADCLTPMEDM